MKRAKKKKKPKIKKIFSYFIPTKVYTFTGQQLNEMRDQMAEEATQKACMIFLGELSEMGWTDDEILGLFDRFSRHVDYANDGVLPAEEVQRMVTEKTGMKFERLWY